MDPYCDSHNQQRNYTTTTGEPPTDIAERIRHLPTVKEVDTPAYDPNNPRLSSDAMTDNTKRRKDQPKGQRSYIAASKLLRHLAQLVSMVLWV